MAHPEKIHPAPSCNGAAPSAPTGASAHIGHETNSYREPAPPWIRTGVPQTIRRNQLRLLVPLADSTIYEMEQRGEFPRRFSLTSRCVVWDLAEVEAWIEQRKRDSYASRVRRAPAPDVHMRRTRPTSKSARSEQ
jgi:prophage regulatory protein